MNDNMTVATVTRSLRTTRVYARAPRVVAGVLALVLIAAGLRATLDPEKAPAPVRSTPAAAVDQGAQAFAEAFVHAYLTWDAADPSERERRLRPFLAGLDADGGLRPAEGARQRVLWTAPVAARRTPGGQLITLAAQTTGRLYYLTVPVSRGKGGFLAIAAYPALVGPPATDAEAPPPDEDDVDDDALTRVVERALRNYLGGNRGNLPADLTSDAVVSLPSQTLNLTRVTAVTWAVPARRVAVQVAASDTRHSAWTLRYELDVVKRDRWYVRSIQVDPTYRGPE